MANNLLIIIFWSSLAIPFYSYLLYPFVLKVISNEKIESNNLNKNNEIKKITMIVAAYNEEKVIREKIENMLSLDYSDYDIEILLGSDGSQDLTSTISNEYINDDRFNFFDLPRGGKVNVLNELISKSTGDICVFSDANSMFESNAVLELVSKFTDNVGCVSGKLELIADDLSGAAGEGFYWKYEAMVKNIESERGILSGANGAIYAARRDLLERLPGTIINDDFYISNSILRKDYSVILNNRAIAYEQANGSLDEQFKRHIRDGAGHYQMISVFKNMIFPFFSLRNFAFFSHRVLRWIVPICILNALVTNFLLVGQGAFYNVFIMIQAICYIIFGFYFHYQKNGKQIKFINAGFYFLCINIALALGFFRLVTGKQKQTWETIR